MKVKDLLVSVVNIVLLNTNGGRTRNFALKFHLLLHWCIDFLECRNFSLKGHTSAVLHLQTLISYLQGDSSLYGTGTTAAIHCKVDGQKWRVHGLRPKLAYLALNQCFPSFWGLWQGCQIYFLPRCKSSQEKRKILRQGPKKYQPFFPNLSAVTKSYETILSKLLNGNIPQSQL